MDNNENKPQKESNKIVFESLEILIRKWMDGSINEIFDDWRWIFTYTKKYKWAVVYVTVLGLVSTTMGLVSSITSKYLLDIITGYKSEYLWLLVAIMIGSTLFSLIIGNMMNRYNLKLSIDISNAIQSDIFDKIMDAEWLAINQYPNGDVLNRFNSDVGTITSNAISWIPSIIIAVYNFIATFLVILNYDVIT